MRRLFKVSDQIDLRSVRRGGPGSLPGHPFFVLRTNLFGGVAIAHETSIPRLRLAGRFLRLEAA